MGDFTLKPVTVDVDEALPKMYRWRVGYWINEKKLKKMNFDEFISVAKLADMELVPIDVNKDLEAQGPYDAIIHKLSDFLVLGGQGDAQALNIIKKIENYLVGHPEIVVLDPLDCVRKLCDRYQQYSLIQDVCKTDGVFTPPFVDLTSKDAFENSNKLSTAGISYPFVCKPLVAHGSGSAHQMSIIFDENGLKDVDPPCVAQTFIRHNAILYKIFVIGDKFFVVPRPSLKNFRSGPFPTIFFDSHDVSKEGCTSYLSELSEEDKKISAPALLNDRLPAVVIDIRRKSGISLFGLDIIVETETGNHYIIDVNSFPSYDGVKDVYNTLTNLIIDALKDQEENLMALKSEYDDGQSYLLVDNKICTQFLTVSLSIVATEPNNNYNIHINSTNRNSNAFLSILRSGVKSASECLLDSGIGSCTESDNSDCEKKLKALSMSNQSDNVQLLTPGRLTAAAGDCTTSRQKSPNRQQPTSAASCFAARLRDNKKFATISTPTAAYAEQRRLQQHSKATDAVDAVNKTLFVGVLNQVSLNKNDAPTMIVNTLAKDNNISSMGITVASTSPVVQPQPDWSRIKRFYGIPKPFNSGMSVQGGGATTFGKTP